MNAIQHLNQEILSCSICPQEKVGKCVIGEGSQKPKVMFIGEAPGKTESETGRPFVGRSGKLLRRLIKEIGISEDDIYITSVVKYLPRSGTPKPSDILHGKTHLIKQIEILDPSLVVLLGKTAASAVLTAPISISKNHGTLHIQNSRKYFLTAHPAAALRFQKYRDVIEDDFKILKRTIDKSG